MNEIVRLYKDKPIRIVEKDGNPWFVANDVCAILELGNPRSSLALLKEKERGVHIVDTLGGKQEMVIINEAGLYRLIFKSRKPEAEVFKTWVYEEVLPSIRKTGAYVQPNHSMEALVKMLEEIKAQYLAMIETNAMMRQQLDYLMQFAPKTAYGSLSPNGEQRTKIRRGANVTGKGRLIEHRNPGEIGYRQMDLFEEYLPKCLMDKAVNIIHIHAPGMLSSHGAENIMASR